MAENPEHPPESSSMPGNGPQAPEESISSTNAAMERTGSSDVGFERSRTPPLAPVSEESRMNPAVERTRASTESTARPTTPANPVSPAHPPPPPIPGIRRSGTLPPSRRASDAAARLSTGRRRGRSISIRELEQLEQPRPDLLSHDLGRLGSLRRSKEEERMGAIPESRAVSPEAAHSPFVSTGMRRRTSTMRTTASVRRRGTVSRPVLNTGSSGAAMTGDNQSANFSLAGPPAVQEVVNQPYVDPGYVQLNPAYENPTNARPVWGLAKPLPRVLRPGMVPTRSELTTDANEAGSQRPGARTDGDLEQGVQPTLRLHKISSQLDDVRRQREANLVRQFSHSPSARTLSHSTLPFPDLAETDIEEDLGTPRPQDPNRLVEEHSSSMHGEARADWDNASAETETPEPGDLDGDWIGDEVPLAAYRPLDEEVHNLHTHWSVIRVRFREPLAELLAVTVQLTLGFSADLVVATSSTQTGTNTDWAWGLATMIGVYIAGGISGAHLNPAISIMLYIYRGFPLRKIPMYVAAQLLGAFIAAFIAFGIYRNGIIHSSGSNLAAGGTVGSFITFPRYDWVDGSTAFFSEFVATAILGICVLALGDDTNAPPGAGMNAFIIGLVIVALNMSFAYNTGAAMNPSRDLGPRLAVLALGYGTDVFTTAYWFWGPWCATISGAIFGGFLYDVAIFVGGESPVNYPRKRIKRAGRKWKKKMAARLRGRKRTVKIAEGHKEYDGANNFGS
ncbi:putative membrane protein [Lachnellula occidentalis]|uniref:Putative membrane protein n=1 Tax=Lachnellula occidentalis TaxID=215460 RepID=A0A8H8UC74_9HELO|nr:putative membrane protein [Lachnellula occidentalis]